MTHFVCTAFHRRFTPHSCNEVKQFTLVGCCILVSKIWNVYSICGINVAASVFCGSHERTWGTLLLICLCFVWAITARMSRSYYQSNAERVRHVDNFIWIVLAIGTFYRLKHSILYLYTNLNQSSFISYTTLIFTMSLLHISTFKIYRNNAILLEDSQISILHV